MATRQNKAGRDLAPASTVTPIRPDMARVASKNRSDDGPTVAGRKLVEHCRSLLADTQGQKERIEAACLFAAAEGRLPSRNLRCIVSTLDERRDFELRCIEVETLKAQHALNSLKVDRLYVLEGVPHWESETQAPMVRSNNELWNTYQERLLQLAETPARTRAHAERKARIIGTYWLRPTTSGDYFDRLRAGVAADEAWLAVNAPKKGRR